MANKAIRGITVEIGGDTSRLDKAIAGSEKKSRSLQVELKEINKLLKFDPSNVDLLTQKQSALGEMIDSTSDKLNTLKEAEAQVIAQFEKGEIGENQLRAFQREIMQTEKDLDGMQKELQETETALANVGKKSKKGAQDTDEYKEAVEKAKNELADFKDQVDEAYNAVATGAAAIGGAAIATAGYALNLSTEFDKAFNTLITKTGASADEMDELNESMERVYANNFGESIEDVANSMATVKTQTGLVGEELQVATENALLMRDTFDFEVNESIRAVNSLMDQFGITSEEAYNLIAQGAQKGLNQNDDLLDTINEYSVQFKNAGYSAEDMFNMLANGVESGTWSVDKLGDAVKEFNIRMSDGSAKDAVEALGFSWEKVSEAWSKGGDSAKDVFNMLVNELDGLENTTEGYNIGVGLMGTMFEDLGQDAVLALSNTQGEIDKTSKALEDINNTKYDDIGSAIQGLGRTLETDVIKPLGEELKPVVEEAIEYVQDNGPKIKDILSEIVDKVGEFVRWVVDNGATLLSVIGGIGAAFVTWKVASMISGLIGVITSFVGVLKTGAGVMAALNAVMAINPVVLIVTAIAGLVTAFVLLWKNCEGFRNFWIGLWEKIKEMVQSFLDWITPAFEAFVAWAAPIFETIKGFFSDLWAKVQEAWAAIVESLQPLIDAVFGAFQAAWDLIKTVWDLVAPYFQDVWELIKAVFVVVKDVLALYFKNAWEGIKLAWSVAVSYFQTIWENIKLVFSVVKTFFSGMFKTAWEAIKAVWNNVIGYFTAIWDSIRLVFSVVKSVLTGNWRDAWEGIKGIVKTWTSYFSSVWDSIKSVFSSVGSWFSSTFGAAWNAIKGIFSNWGSFFSGLWDKIKTTFSKIGTNISEAISGSITGGINGVISAIENIINRGIGLINGAINLINKLPGVSVGKLGKLSLPRLAKGTVVTSPTIAEIGEDGAEAVVPLENNTGWIKKVARDLNDQLSVDRRVGADSALLSRLDKIYERLHNLEVVLDSGETVGALIDKIDSSLNDRYDKFARGW